MSLAAELDRPAPRMVEPVDRPQRRRLARAVRADQRHDLALVHLDRDALQRLDRAVERLDVRRAARQRLRRVALTS